MPLLTSNSGLLGMPCPDFHLQSVLGEKFSLDSFKKSQALLICFICNHCPYVKAIEDRLIGLSKRYEERSLQVVGICSNDAKNYPDDAKDKLLARWKDKNYGFPYLVDEEQNVARAFSAVCTPEFYLFDADRRLFYHGRLDDSWNDEAKVKKQDLLLAIDALLSNEEAPMPQHPSMGCSMKWRV